MKLELMLWRGQRVDKMSREQLIGALNELATSERQRKDSMDKAFDTLKILSAKRARLARVDGISIGLVIGVFAGATVVGTCWVIFLLTW